MTAERFLNEQSQKELGNFLTKYMQGEPPSMILPRVEEIESPAIATLREQFEHEDVQRKRQYYNDLYQAAKRFIFSYEVYDLTLK